ncbi:hypothetical protein PM8797T_06632 [Gimesia maris DSM 8797]|nr:hypothetical protein PM8797T_06632 [Gimesia maris DSM 8797]HAW28347.1 hypothetical protein [Planctomycetaceae bacterium]
MFNHDPIQKALKMRQYTRFRAELNSPIVNAKPFCSQGLLHRFIKSSTEQDAIVTESPRYLKHLLHRAA